MQAVLYLKIKHGLVKMGELHCITTIVCCIQGDLIVPMVEHLLMLVATMSSNELKAISTHCNRHQS